MEKSKIGTLPDVIKDFYNVNPEKAKDLPGLGIRVSEDGMVSFKSICCFCPAAVWRTKREHRHISMYCKVLSSEYADHDIEFVDDCMGYYEAVEELKMLADED